MPVAVIESLDHEGRGIARCDGKAIFVEGALPGERVEYLSYRKRPNYEQANLSRVIKSCAQRVEPRCQFFGVCGGCSMQHVEMGAQVAAKQRVLEDALWHIGRIKPEVVFSAIHGPAWNYRDRSRFAVHLVPRKGGALVGFHEKRSGYIADMTSCEILPPQVSALLQPLRTLISGLSIADRIPQIEVAIGEDRTVLALRNQHSLTRQDESRLLDFGSLYSVSIWIQPGGPDTVRPLAKGEDQYLYYSLPEFDLRLRFRPTDFTQVNVHINRLLIRRAMQLLDPQPGERIADLFCGLGNFSLPIARKGARVVGVEGCDALVRRARENAELNGLSACSEFLVSNLFEADSRSLAALGRIDKMLIDPPRDGAAAVVKAFDDAAPSRIVYVSCNPATLARDAAVLVHEKGYRLCGAGIANMFPQTSHVESIALFKRG